MADVGELDARLDGSRLEPPRAGGARSLVWALIVASRPRTLTAALVPVGVGSAIAYARGGFVPWVALAAWASATLLQIGTNYANDVYDHERGADTAARVGPVRAVASGIIDPGTMRRAMLGAFVLAFGIGVYLVAVGGPVIVAVGLASILFGYAYTGGPYPLAYHGLGDVFVIAFFGLVAVGGTTFVQTHALPPLALFAGLSVGCVATCLLAVNNVRDRETDRAANKRTLVVRFGRRFGVFEHGALIAVAHVSMGVAIACGLAGPLVLLPLVTLPLALRLQRALARVDGPALNGVLAGVSKLLLLHGTTLAFGIALDAAWR